MPAALARQRCSPLHSPCKPTCTSRRLRFPILCGHLPAVKPALIRFASSLYSCVELGRGTVFGELGTGRHQGETVAVPSGHHRTEPAGDVRLGAEDRLVVGYRTRRGAMYVGRAEALVRPAVLSKYRG